MNKPQDSLEFHDICLAVLAYLRVYGTKQTLQMLVTMFETVMSFEFESTEKETK